MTDTKYYDCSTTTNTTYMCPVCDPNTTQQACTGVVGAAQTEQVNNVNITDNANPVWQYGNNTLIPGLRKYDNGNCLGPSGLGISDAYGNCINSTIGLNNTKLTRKTNLVVGADEDSTPNGSFDRFSTGTSFELQCLHKVWGDGKTGPLAYNRGVNGKNVYVGGSPENINYTLKGNSVSKKQRVLYMEAHGDNYTGNVAGLIKSGIKNSVLQCLDSTNKAYAGTTFKAKNACNDGDNPLFGCIAWDELKPADDENWNKRVGGCSATKDNFGPGVYNLLCYVPKTEDTTTDGRGYVFAIWPFHYEEIYKSDANQFRDNTKFPCYNQCDNPANKNPKCQSDCDTAAFDLFSSINHEIDIEIPCNSPQFGDNWKEKMTWSTMNCNTWNNDINNYDADTGAYYTQVAVQNPTGIFISTKPESSNSKDYHWYTINWYVDSSDYTNNYVEFYFDDPFDPYGTTTVNGTKLPLKPTNKPLHRTQRFVPTRGGRLNFGPWMAWWGYNAQKGGKPNFDTAKVRLAHLSIIPYQTAQNWDANNHYYSDSPQSFDQLYTNCDFRELFSLPSPPTSLSTATSLTKILIIGGSILSGLIIISIIFYFYLKHKRKLKLQLKN